MIIKRISILLIILFISKASIIVAQVDSLLLLLKNEHHDTTKISIYNQLSAHYTKINPDTAYFYVNQSLKLSEKYLNADDENLLNAVKKHMADSYTLLGNYYKALGNYDEAVKSYKNSLNKRRELGDNSGVANNYIDIGIAKSNKGDYFVAVDYYKNAVKILDELNDEPGLAKVHRNIGNVYYYQGEWDMALESYQKSLKICEKTDDLEGVSRNQNNIGIIHLKTERYNWAIEYFKKSLDIKKQIGDERGVATCYNNMGDVYFKKKDFKEALKYYEISLKMRKEVKDTRGAAFSLTNIGKLLVEEKNFARADSFYKASLQIFEEIKDKEQISLVYNEISAINLKQGNYEESVRFADLSLDIAKDLQALPRIRDSYELLYQAYEHQYNISKAFYYFKLYFENYKLYVTIKDSIYSSESNKLIEREQRYRIDQKQNEIETQNLLIKNKEADEKNLRMQMSFLLAGFASMIVFAFILFRNYKQKTKANKLLEEQKKEIQKAKEEIEAQRDIVMEQNALVLAQKKEIEDSIIYAQNIQKAILPSRDLRDEILPEHFIFFRPRNIVSGDFFWMKQLKNFVVVAIADCTGHGVPGAFMSMLGFMFLNELVTTRSLDSAGQILDRLRDKVKKSLHQSGKEGEAKDGMDMSFFIIDTETRELQFSGAFNPLYIVRDNDKINENLELENENIKMCKPSDESINATLFEIKADRQPIAIYMYEKDFQTHIFKLEKGDRIYSFTDGYPDQFGGDEGKKFNAKRFKEFLLKIGDHPMENQLELVTNNFYTWMGELEQVDDVLLMGLRMD
ncbi:MAG: tetratricopeptide repeat protein [Bacteroidales bacterium]|nr:tetratricopeptide repeat protein [Bacteroidales bacterium]